MTKPRKGDFSPFSIALTSKARRLLSPVSLALLIPLALGACKEEAKIVEPPAPVRVMTVAFTPVTATRRYTGTVRPRYESDISFRVTGKIIARHINAGDTVKAGQLIAALDATDYRLVLQSLEAELAAARTSLATAIAAQQRQTTLKKKGWGAQEAVDQAVAAADEAQARVNRAERALAVQRNQVQYTELRADHDGVISNLPVETGQVVAAGQLVARIARLDELEAAVAIPERNLEAMRRATATVELWPQTGQHFAARLREVAAEADPVSRLFEARFTIISPHEDVRLGKTVSLTLSSQNEEAAVRLPLSAVMNDAKGPHVWVVDAQGTGISRRPITIKSFAQEAVLVSEGLRANERVVTLGVHVLDEGKPVRIVETNTQISTRQGAQP